MAEEISRRLFLKELCGAGLGLAAKPAFALTPPDNEGTVLDLIKIIQQKGKYAGKTRYLSFTSSEDCYTLEMADPKTKDPISITAFINEGAAQAGNEVYSLYGLIIDVLDKKSGRFEAFMDAGRMSYKKGTSFRAPLGEGTNRIGSLDQYLEVDNVPEGTNVLIVPEIGKAEAYMDSAPRFLPDFKVAYTDRPQMQTDVSNLENAKVVGRKDLSSEHQSKYMDVVKRTLKKYA